ncbi:hypothetical protein VOLCADRAFT_100117 [Volvox carteri f. nagariensis]|uniref:Uncharacterized protein n=1 Tax=Volvox carteri f. nagariensis TaxID=3068 RepID=D8UJG4_VOLCA|nr:uncharacterized protein VOLCADRAFT_100117 [Volvox carteri f. nagariensis]EFJ40139.1 hypothetical protein VOLCADRAFT_100117 [Volvox carteri f. nagariensis]|eukprot:XP_002958796.1 hypothetical protein VOLCADRAFT_100117 [Volvox carteri f. nagariensis]
MSISGVSKLRDSRLHCTGLMAATAPYCTAAQLAIPPIFRGGCAVAVAEAAVAAAVRRRFGPSMVSMEALPSGPRPLMHPLAAASNPDAEPEFMDATLTPAASGDEAYARQRQMGLHLLQPQPQPQQQEPESTFEGLHSAAFSTRGRTPPTSQSLSRAIHHISPSISPNAAIYRNESATRMQWQPAAVLLEAPPRHGATGCRTAGFRSQVDGCGDGNVAHHYAGDNHAATRNGGGDGGGGVNVQLPLEMRLGDLVLSGTWGLAAAATPAAAAGWPSAGSDDNVYTTECSLARMWTDIFSSAAAQVISALPPQPQQQAQAQPSRRGRQLAGLPPPLPPAPVPQVSPQQPPLPLSPSAPGLVEEVEADEHIRSFGAVQSGGGGGGGGVTPGRGTGGASCSLIGAAGGRDRRRSVASGAAVGRYGKLLMSSPSWWCTELYDIHDSLLLSKISASRDGDGGGGGSGDCFAVPDLCREEPWSARSATTTGTATAAAATAAGTAAMLSTARLSPSAWTDASVEITKLSGDGGGGDGDGNGDDTSELQLLRDMEDLGPVTPAVAAQPYEEAVAGSEIAGETAAAAAAAAAASASASATAAIAPKPAAGAPAASSLVERSTGQISAAAPMPRLGEQVIRMPGTQTDAKGAPGLLKAASSAASSNTGRPHYTPAVVRVGPPRSGGGSSISGSGKLAAVTPLRSRLSSASGSAAAGGAANSRRSYELPVTSPSGNRTSLQVSGRAEIVRRMGEVGASTASTEGLLRYGTRSNDGTGNGVGGLQSRKQPSRLARLFGALRLGAKKPSKARRSVSSESDCDGDYIGGGCRSSCDGNGDVDGDGGCNPSRQERLARLAPLAAAVLSPPPPPLPPPPPRRSININEN